MVDIVGGAAITGAAGSAPCGVNCSCVPAGKSGDGICNVKFCSSPLCGEKILRTGRLCAVLPLTTAGNDPARTASVIVGADALGVFCASALGSTISAAALPTDSMRALNEVSVDSAASANALCVGRAGAAGFRLMVCALGRAFAPAASKERELAGIFWSALCVGAGFVSLVKNDSAVSTTDGALAGAGVTISIFTALVCGALKFTA